MGLNTKTYVLLVYDIFTMRQIRRALNVSSKRAHLLVLNSCAGKKRAKHMPAILPLAIR